MQNRVPALVVAVLVMAILPTGSAFAVDPTPSPSQSQTPTPVVTASPTPTVTAVPNKPRTCSIRQVASSANLAYFYGYAMNANTGEVYLNIRGDQQTPSASVMI